MMKTIATLSVALFLSACATGQPVNGIMHHCEQSHCKNSEKCTCEDCKHMDTGKICPHHAPMSTPDKP